MIRMHQMITLSDSILIYNDAVQLTCQDNTDSPLIQGGTSRNLNTCSGCATLDATRFQQSIIVTHQQMTLNLLQRVENNSNKNQQ